MTSEIVLYEYEDPEKEDITAEPSAGYDVMLDKLEKDLDRDAHELLAVQVQDIIHRSIQAQQQQGSSQIHKAYANLLSDLEDTGEVDVDVLVENAIHNLSQQSQE